MPGVGEEKQAVMIGSSSDTVLYYTVLYSTVPGVGEEKQEVMIESSSDSTATSL